MSQKTKKIDISKGDRRQEIAVAGLKVFCEKGYDNSTVDDIVKKANCSHGLFYHYYKSKKEIFEEILKSHKKNKDQTLINEIEKTSSYIDKLNIILKSFFKELKSDELFAYHYYFFVSQMFTNKDKLTIPPKEDLPKPPILIMQEFFEKGQQNGEFTTKYSAKECARLFISIVQGATIGYVIAPKEIQKIMELPSTDFIIDIFKKELNNED